MIPLKNRDSDSSFWMTGMVATIAVTALALVLAACNGGDDVSAVETQPTSEPTEEVWPPPPEPTPEPAVAQDIETLATQAGCEISPTEFQSDPWMTETAPEWINAGDMLVAPYDPSSGNWYSGHLSISWMVETWEHLDDETEVTGENQESAATIDPASIEHRYEVPNGVVATAWIEIPEPGCWSLMIGDVELTVFVLPDSENPEIIARSEEREAIIPYPVPESCAVTEWHGPATSQGTPVGYWLGEDEARIYTGYGLLYTNQSEVLVLTEDDDAKVDGHSTTNTALTVRSELQRVSQVPVPILSAELSFPVSGCWNLIVEAGGETIDATVYVFPDACRRAAGAELSTDCIPPDET